MKRQPTFYKAHDGHEYAVVPLANTKLKATLDAEVYRQLRTLGVSPNWRLSQGVRRIGYPAVTVLDRPQFVARLIAGVGPGRQVSYRDGNRLNLRRSNLQVTKARHAKGDCAALLEAVACGLE